MNSLDLSLPTRNQSVFELGFDRPDDRFIPVRAGDLTAALTRDEKTFGPEVTDIRGVATAIADVIAQEVTSFERDLAESYVRLNPDRDTIVLSEDQAEDPAVVADRVTEGLSYLLEKANFEKLNEEQVIAATRAANTHGMKVRLDPDRLSGLHVWVRGHGASPHWQRTLRSPFRGRTIDLPTFRRLTVIARLKEVPQVHVKLFKEIPIRDLEALLPNANVRMGLRDLALLIGGSGGAVWSVATKIIATGFAAAGSILYIAALPLAGLGWRTFSGYRRATKDRDSQRTRNLYFQNLGNNASAIHMLGSMISEEETKEALLLYAFCSSSRKMDALVGSSVEELDKAIERYIESNFGVSVNFDMPDAMETMDRLHLWEDRATLKALRSSDAIKTLQDHWHEKRSIQYHSLQIKAPR